MSHSAVMNVLKSKWFTKWAKKAKVYDNLLLHAIDNIEHASSVSLGAGLYKIRVQRNGGGKSGGFRTFVIYRKDQLAVFVLGFAKNETSNISTSDLTDLKKQAKHILGFSKKQVGALVTQGTFIKVETKK